jgi:predicted Zn finger-like uncharacterized protein
MILTCPSCGTQYVVKDGAIPPGGRQVRCASCKHSWHQDPETSEAAIEEAAPPPVAEQPIEPEPVAEDQDESLTEATLIEPRSGPELEERAFEEAAIEGETEREPVDHAHSAPAGANYAGMAMGAQAAEPAEDWREPPEGEAQDDEFSPFPAADELAPRRRSPILTLLLIVLVVAALAAAFWFLAPPEWKAQLGLGVAGASPLALVTTHMDRQRLESGNDLLTVTGRVINPTGKEQDVPPLQAQLKDRAGKVVYRWTIQPPAPSLAPGASASFNSAEISVPPGGEELTISLGSPGA